MGGRITREAIDAALSTAHQAGVGLPKVLIRQMLNAALPDLVDDAEPSTLQSLIEVRHQLAEAKPTEYEMWRDALTLAAMRSNSATATGLVDDAHEFLTALKNPPAAGGE